MKYLKAVSLLVTVAFFSGVIYFASTTNNDNYKQTKSVTSTKAISGTLIKKDIGQLAREAATIIVGSVDRRLPSGKDNSEWRGTEVYTDVIVNVERYIKNSRTEKEIVVRLAGGSKDGEEVWVEDEARLDENENVLLFLKKDPDKNWVVNGMLQGKYSLNNGIAKRPDGENGVKTEIIEQEIRKELDN